MQSVRERETEIERDRDKKTFQCIIKRFLQLTTANRKHYQKKKNILTLNFSKGEMSIVRYKVLSMCVLLLLLTIKNLRSVYDLVKEML